MSFYARLSDIGTDYLNASMFIQKEAIRKVLTFVRDHPTIIKKHERDATSTEHWSTRTLILYLDLVDHDEEYDEAEYDSDDTIRISSHNGRILGVECEYDSSCGKYSTFDIDSNMISDLHFIVTHHCQECWGWLLSFGNRDPKNRVRTQSTRIGSFFIEPKGMVL
jgi:hypothetical protein